MSVTKERPILFSSEMIRAILEGRKTQTRRVIKFKHWPELPVTNIVDHFMPYEDSPNNWCCWTADHQAGNAIYSENEIMCPYGFIGDRLWVRETFAIEWYENEPKPQPGRPISYHKEENEFDTSYWLWPHYKATDPAPELCYEDDDEDDGPKCKWTPSIHMPRWASRITLEVVSIIVKRVNEISEDDAVAEGIDGIYGIQGFSELWNKINAKRGFSWEANPWVWVIEFKRLLP